MSVYPTVTTEDERAEWAASVNVATELESIARAIALEIANRRHHHVPFAVQAEQFEGVLALLRVESPTVVEPLLIGIAEWASYQTCMNCHQCRA